MGEPAKRKFYSIGKYVSCIEMWLVRDSPNYQRGAFICANYKPNHRQFVGRLRITVAASLSMNKYPSAKIKCGFDSCREPVHGNW